MQIADQLAGRAGNGLESDVAIEIAGTASADSWLGGTAQADLEIKNLE